MPTSNRVAEKTLTYWRHRWPDAEFRLCVVSPSLGVIAVGPVKRKKRTKR